MERRTSDKMKERRGRVANDPTSLAMFSLTSIG